MTTFNSRSWLCLDFCFHTGAKRGSHLLPESFAAGLRLTGKTHLDAAGTCQWIGLLLCFPETTETVGRFPIAAGDSSCCSHSGLPFLNVDYIMVSSSAPGPGDSSKKLPTGNSLASAWCWAKTWQRTDLQGLPELHLEIQCFIWNSSLGVCSMV